MSLTDTDPGAPPPAPAAADGSHGRIELVLGLRDGVTRPLRCLAAPPLQLSRARYDDPRRPTRAAFTALQLGGVLAGDRYSVTVTAEAGAEARVVGGAATQVLQMAEGEAAQELTLRACAGSKLLWLPEPLILFGGATYTQRTRVELGPGALVALLDVLAPGRLARGERFRFRRYEAQVEICDPDGKLLAAERALIAPERRDPAAPGLFGALPVLGSLYLLGRTFDAEGLAAELQPDLGATGGVGALPNGAGVLVRIAGATPSAVRAALLRALEAATGRIDPPSP